MMQAFRSSLLLSILCHMIFTSPSSLVVRANDDCSDAVVINADSSNLPFQTTGDVTLATADAEFATPTDTVGNLTCGISTAAIGVWYRIDASSSDTFLKATISDAPGTSTRFNVALFEGSSSSCSDKECHLASEYQLENQRTEPALTWFATEGMSYFLHVAGINADEIGAFVLDLEEVSLSASPPNDKCTTAESLGDMETVTVDTTGAMPHGMENAECGMQAFSRGVFYEVQGTGQTMAATVTTTELGDDNEGRLELAVMTDGCNACLSVSDFLTIDDTPHTLEFETTLGQTYVVTVSGERFSDVGLFEILLEAKAPPPGSNPEKLSDVSASGSSNGSPPDAMDVFSGAVTSRGRHSSKMNAGLFMFGVTMGVLLISTLS